MTIIKNKLTQTILIGFLFAFLLGVSSFIVRNTLISDKSNFESQLIIIETVKKNKIQENLKFLNRIYYINSEIELNQELYNSIQYIKIRYQKDERLSAGCNNFTLSLADKSIFLNTSSYLLKNRKNYETCLNDLFLLSFERLKEKFNFENLKEKNNNIYKETLDTDHDKSFFNDSEKNCKTLSVTYNQLIKKFNLALESDDKLDYNESANIKDFIEIFNLHQNLAAARSLNDFCNNMFNLSSQYLMDEYAVYLKKFNDNLKTAKFEQVFKIENISILDKNNPNQYLSERNVDNIFTFRFYFWSFIIL